MLNTVQKKNPAVVPPNTVQRTSARQAQVKTARRGNVIQPAWVKLNGEVTWQNDEEFARNRNVYERSGEQRWYSSWLPRRIPFFGEVNPLLDVYQLKTKLEVRRKNAAEMSDVFSEIQANKYLREISLINCDFPVWSTAYFSELINLESLTFYSPRGEGPSDKLEGLSRKTSLRKLELVMCHFMDEQCYQNLAGMRFLSELSLARTITLEHAIGTKGESLIRPHGTITQVDRVSPVVMHALRSLMPFLQKLDLSWCSALKENDLDELRRLSSCQIIRR